MWPPEDYCTRTKSRLSGQSTPQVDASRITHPTSERLRLPSERAPPQWFCKYLQSMASPGGGADRLPNNSQALAWQAEGSMGDAAWAPSAPQAPLREEGDELWAPRPPSAWTSGASGNRNYGEAGSQGPCSPWVSRRPCLWHAVCKVRNATAHETDSGRPRGQPPAHTAHDNA